MASLLSSLVRGTAPIRRPEDETVTPGGVAPVQPPVSIPPTAQPVAQPALPPRDLASEPLTPSMDVGPSMFDPSKIDIGALFQNALLKSQPQAPVTTVDTSSGPRVLAGRTPAQDITQIKQTDFKIEDISSDAKGLGKFLSDSGGGTYKSGLGLIDDMQTWFNKTTRTAMGEAPMSPLAAGTTRDELAGDSPLRKLVGYAASLKNSDAPYAKEQAKAYSDGILWLTKSIENNDQKAYIAAKANIDSLTKLNTEDFARSGTRSQFARNGQLISAYVTGKTIQQAEADTEAASTPAIQRKVVASAVFDYVQDRFKDLRTQAESGGEGARRAQRTLDVFGQSFKDINAPVTEGTRDARLEAFSSSPQGRALITDAFDNLSGLGYFNRPKFKSIVDRSKAGDVNLTPADIKSIIGETQYKKRLGSTIDVADDLPDDAIQAMKLMPDDPQRISGVYRGLTPQGIGALQGFGDTDQPLGEPLRAGQPDAREFDISQNVRSTDTSTGMTITPVTESTIKTRGELAGAMVSGLGLNTSQAEQIAKRVFADTTDQQNFINAATVSYDIQDDVLTKIASDAGTYRVANTGGQTAGGRAKSTYALVSDVFAAANDVLPQQTFTESSLARRQWDLRKRVLNDAAAQAQQIEGSGADDATSVKRFYTTSDGKPDFTKPIVPDAKDQVGRIALLKAMIDKAAAPDGAAYRRQLELLARSAVDGQPYTGNINMNPKAFQSLVSLYASRVETAAYADASGKTDTWFRNKFGFLPSELSKSDNKNEFMLNLVTASPARLRVFSSSLNGSDASVTSGMIPTTTAGQVIDNAASIPGDIQGGGRKNSRTENQALGNIDRSTKIVNGGFESALNAVLKYNDDPTTVDVPQTKKQYGETLVTVFDKALSDSMKGVTFKSGDKAKFDSLSEAIRTEIIKQADTEWTAGTVTKEDLNAILKPLASRILGVDAQKAKALPAVDKPEPSVVKDLKVGQSAYDKAKAELGGDVGTQKDIAAQLASDESSKSPEHQAFIEKLKERRLVEYGRITKEVETRQLGITTAGAKLNRLKQEGKLNTPEFNAALDAYNKAHDDYNAKRSQLDAAFDLVSQVPSADEMEKILDTKEMKAIGSAARSEAFTKLREKISNGGWGSLTSTERASYYRESLKRYFEGESGNAISPVTRRRLAFRSFIDSPQGANYTPVRLTGLEGEDKQALLDQAYTPQYLTEIKNAKGDVISHKLNPNIIFKYVPKLNKETGRVDSLDIVAEERLTGGDNKRTTVKRQYVVTGREVEITMALNDMKDIKDELASIEQKAVKVAAGLQNVPAKDVRFGFVQDEGNTIKLRDGGSFSQLMQSLVEFENSPELTTKQKAVQEKLIEEGNKIFALVSPTESFSEVVTKYAQRTKSAKRMINFQSALRERLADRIDAFSKTGNSFNVADLQEDINNYFDGGQVDERDNEARATEMAALQKTNINGILRSDKYVDVIFGGNGPLQISAAENTKGKRAITMPVGKAYSQLLELRNKIDGGDKSPESELKFLQLRDKFVEHTGKSISDVDRAFTISNVESANDVVATRGNKQRPSGENFGIRFGEYAERYEPTKTPRPGFETPENIQAFNKKLTKKDKDRVTAEQELGKELGFETKNYSIRSSVWKDLNTKWKNSTPKLWDQYVTDLPDAVRNKILEMYPRWSTEGGVGKNSGPGTAAQTEWRAIDWAVDVNGKVTPEATKVLSSVAQWASANKVQITTADGQSLAEDILRMKIIESGNRPLTQKDLDSFKSPVARMILKGVHMSTTGSEPDSKVSTPLTMFLNAIDPTPIQAAEKIVAQKTGGRTTLPMAERVVTRKLKTDSDFRNAVNQILNDEGEKYVINDKGQIARRSYSAKDPVEPKGLTGDDLFKWRVENAQVTYMDYVRYANAGGDTATQPRDFVIDGKTVTVPAQGSKTQKGMYEFLQGRMSRAEPKSVTNFEAPKSAVVLSPRVDPFGAGRRIGFRYIGDDYFIGAKEYASLVQDINNGKVSMRDIKSLVTALIPKIQYRKTGIGTYQTKTTEKIGVKPVGEGEDAIKKIPKEVQDRMIEEASKEGFSIKKGIRGGIPGFMSAVIAAIIAELNNKEN